MSEPRMAEPWLHTPPPGWRAVRGKFVLRRAKRINVGLLERNRLSLTMAGVLRRSLDDVDGLQAAGYDTYQVFEVDDLVFKLIDLQNIKTSRVGHVPERGIMSPAYLRLRPNPTDILPRFGYWWFTNLYWRKVYNKLGGGVRQALGQAELLELTVPLPSLPTQHAIADFLDRKTAAIDGLIETKQRLLELLAEKRAALINQAVTKGLDPSVPMKDSGVPWIGDIPAHWTVVRMKRVAQREGGIQMGPFGGLLLDIQTQPATYRLYGQVNTISGDFEIGTRWLDQTQFDRLGRYHLKPGDLVLTRKGASIGHARVFPAQCQPGAMDSDTVRLRVQSDLLRTSYALHLLHDAHYLREQIMLERRGAILPNLNSETVGALQLALPPAHEQDEIGVRVSQLGALGHSLSGSLKIQLVRLREYRQALITAAVTGQIDIPEEAA